MVPFATTWPFIGLGAAVVLALLLVTDSLARDRDGPRWQDLRWLAWAGVALTLLHQFEESGIDLAGRPSALLGALCAGFGFRDAVACPVPLAFVTGYNVGTIWTAALIAAVWAARRPLIGLTVFAAPIGNLILHIGAAFGLMRYNPGLVSGLFILPLSAFAMLVAVHRHGAGAKALAALVAAALLTAGGALILLVAAVHGVIGDGALLACLVALGLVPAGLMSLAARDVKPPVPTKAPRQKRARAPASGPRKSRTQSARPPSTVTTEPVE